MNSTVLSDGLLQDGGYVLQTENSTTKSIFSEWLPARCGFQIALSVAYGLVFVTGFIGNGLVIVAVVRGGHKMMRHSVTNIFLVNLAVSDLLVILFYAPINFTLNLWQAAMGLDIADSPLGVLLFCSLGTYILEVSVYASVYSLVALTIERYRSITSPLKPRWTTRTCLKIIAIIWIAACVIPSSLLSVTQKLSIEYGFMVCSGDWPKRWMHAVYLSSSFTLCYAVPLLIIVICYVLIGIRIWKRQIPGQSKQRSLKMIAAVVAAFALAWLPEYTIFVQLLLGEVVPEWEFTEAHPRYLLMIYINSIAQWMGSANSCINPILYNFLDNNFRNRFRQMLCQSTSVQHQ